MKKYLFYLLEVEFLEHGDADLVVQANFCLKLFHPKFGDPWWRENMETFRTCSTSVPSVQKCVKLPGLLYFHVHRRLKHLGNFSF